MYEPLCIFPNIAWILIFDPHGKCHSRLGEIARGILLEFCERKMIYKNALKKFLWILGDFLHVFFMDREFL